MADNPKAKMSEVRIMIEKELVLKRTAEPIRLTPDSPDEFRRAMKILATQTDYRDRAIKDPSMILEDFDLSARELQALAGVARLSGADLRMIDQSVAAELLADHGGLAAADVDVSCCSCCCCCCGETSVAVR